MLLEVLAKTDAVFWPCRMKDLDARRAIEEMRVDFRELGLAWRVGGASSTRQAGLRELDALAAEGRLLVTRAPGRQAAYVKLPDAVDTELRRQACQADYENALPLLGWLQSEIGRGQCYDHCGRTWVRETHLTGQEYDSPDVGRILSAYAEYMLPLLVRGLVESNADCDGRVWYALTPAGEPLARQQYEGGEPRLSLPLEYDEGTRAAYLAATEPERNRLEGCSPRNQAEIAPIPLPVGV